MICRYSLLLDADACCVYLEYLELSNFLNVYLITRDYCKFLFVSDNTTIYGLMTNVKTLRVTDSSPYSLLRPPHYKM